MKTAIVLGTFDGLHAGHRAVIGQADGFYSIAVTFDIPPKGYFNAEPQLLMLLEDRVNRLKQLGIDRVDVQDFSKIKDIEAKAYLEFLKPALCNQMNKLCETRAYPKALWSCYRMALQSHLFQCRRCSYPSLMPNLNRIRYRQ